jgi:hypothetical protein
MRLTDPLNDRQLQVLRWIADGCRDGIMTGHAYKTTARALQDRQLVKISKREGTWSAVITEVGRHYLDHGEFPPRRPVADKRLARRPVQAGPNSHQQAASVNDGPPSPPADRPTKPRKLSPTEQLVADVVAAGGYLKIPRDGSHHGRSHAEELVRSANRYGKTPAGKRLVHDFIIEGESWLGPRADVFTLVDGPEGTDEPLLPVPVPEEVGRYHSAVSALRKAKSLPVGASVERRTLRILHALAAEAERRGYTVTARTSKLAAGRRDQPVEWHLLLASRGEVVPLRIDEETERVEHVPTPQEVRAHDRNPWTQISTHDHVASGRLRIDIGGASQLERKSFWADRALWSLEDKLPELLREVAVRIDELRLRRAAKIRAEEDYRQAVEREEERARARAAEAHREKILEDHLSRWRLTQELTAYAAAVTTLIEAAEAEAEVSDEVIADARRWLAWIVDRADRQNPVRRLPSWPEDAKLGRYELSQFMGRVPEPADMRYQPDSY